MQNLISKCLEWLWLGTVNLIKIVKKVKSFYVSTPTSTLVVLTHKHHENAEMIIKNNLQQVTMIDYYEVLNRYKLDIIIYYLH